MRLANLIVLFALAILTNAATAQQYPLPELMEATFPGMWAEQLWLPAPLTTDVINAKISYENGDTNKVSIEWFCLKTGATNGHAFQSFDVSYRPTAIARRAGTTTKFYVVGWSDRTGRVVVESWTFGTFVLGSAASQGGGMSQSTMSLPPITRVVEWISDANTVPPVWDAACQVYGNKLLMLTSGTPTKIVSLNLTTLALTVAYNSTAYPALAGCKMLIIGRHGSDGLVAVAEPRRTWDDPMSNPDASLYFVARDTNTDGAFDLVSSEQAQTFYYVYPQPWDNKYVGP